MTKNFIQKSIGILLRRQTNILSAALVIMATVILSQFLGLIRQRLLVTIFGASDTLGVYLASSRLPDLLFQLIIAGALSSAFIPVFSEYLGKGKEEEAKKLAASLLSIGLVIFFVFSLVLFVFAPFFLLLINPGSGFSKEQMDLMSSLLRVVVISQLLFIIATFFSAMLQSYNHFFVPGFAAASYNLGIIIGILFLSPFVGIYAAPYGMILGAILFILLQIPLVTKVGFSFKPSFAFRDLGVQTVGKLMWPRTLSLGVFQLGTLAIVALVSFLSQAGRNYVIFDYGQTIAFAPTALFGQAIAQAAFPVLARERERLDLFKATFITSFNQLLYLVLPVSALFIVLRVPIIRLIFGAGQFDWPATILTSKILAILSISIFAQALISLVARGFYALHDTKTPLIIGSLTTLLMIAMGAFFVLYHNFGIESIAVSYSIASIVNLVVSFIYLDRKTHGFLLRPFIATLIKIFSATFFTGIALYVPVKLLDQLVIDTTHTINLLILTGISTIAGLSLYLFLTWFFNVKEATTFLLLFKKLGNWREILRESQESIDHTRPV